VYSKWRWLPTANSCVRSTQTARITDWFTVYKSRLYSRALRALLQRIQYISSLTPEVGSSILQIDKSMIDNYRYPISVSNHRFTKSIDLSIPNEHNNRSIGSIIIDLRKKFRYRFQISNHQDTSKCPVLAEKNYRFLDKKIYFSIKTIDLLNKLSI
jgi:hypothetical protein